MECLTPNKVYYLPDGTTKFGRAPKGEPEQDVPCGYCDICLTGKAKLRGFKHFSNTLYTTDDMFITLTYGQFYPITPSGKATLDKTAPPRFVKRLRKYLKSIDPELEIGVLYNREYGDEEERPHYHFLIFNYSFPDKYYWRTTKKGYDQFRSPTLEKLWPFGNSEIGTVTPASATYVASYIYKKKYGKDAEQHYDGREPEYVVTPKKNYVSGRQFIRDNIDNIAEHGCFKTLEGHSIGIDTHTLQWIQKEYPEHYLKIKLIKESYVKRTLSKQEKENLRINLDAKSALMKGEA